MASLSDFLAAPSGQPTAIQFATQTPQYRNDFTLPNLQEDAAIAKTRGIQDYGERTLPGLANQGAALGQTGSSGLNTRAQFAATDFGRSQSDIGRMLSRNTANIAQQNVLATFGAMGP